MNRQQKRAIAFKKRGVKNETERNAEIFRDVLIRKLAQQSRNREKRTPPLKEKATAQEGVGIGD